MPSKSQAQLRTKVEDDRHQAVAGKRVFLRRKETLIFSDKTSADGVVVVPIKLAPELLAKASEHHEWEEFSKLKLSQGGDLRKYYPLREDAQVEYQEWRKNQK